MNNADCASPGLCQRCSLQSARSDMFCRRGGTTLMRAVEEGHESIVRLFLENGADVNAADE